MCRFLLYFGNESILLADLVTKPNHSIVHQSFEAQYLPFFDDSTKKSLSLNHKINGDGFGVAWYNPEESESPCVFTSTKPSWNDVNLQRLSSHVRSKCVFAHVRAASPGSLIVDTNCHPFRAGRLLFMHNGCIAHFKRIKKTLISELNEDCYGLINGTTDTEHVFAIFVSHLPDQNPSSNHSGHVLKEAMLHTINDVLRLTMTCGEKPEPSSMNFAVTNGEVVIATRFRNSAIQEPPSLYLSKNVRYECSTTTSNCSVMNGLKRSCNLVRSCDLPNVLTSVVVCSEPLSYNEDEWSLVPKNSLLVITTSQKIKMEAIEVDPAYIIQTETKTNLYPEEKPLPSSTVLPVDITIGSASPLPHLRKTKSSTAQEERISLLKKAVGAGDPVPVNPSPKTSSKEEPVKSSEPTVSMKSESKRSSDSNTINVQFSVSKNCIYLLCIFQIVFFAWVVNR